nr:GNAT family N-acetyltransferase [Propionibacterium sp.]
MTDPTVRLALPGEAEQIAALQRRGWTQTLPPGLAAAVLGSVSLAAMTDAWRRAILAPPLAEYRVLVAVGSGRLAGFAAIGPADDPDAVAGRDATIGEFVIDPRAQRQGHGSRLLNAAVDTLRADRFVRATWWLRTTDDALRAFVLSSGWAADGAHREVAAEDGAETVRLVRLHTAL